MSLSNQNYVNTDVKISLSYLYHISHNFISISIMKKTDLYY